MNTILVVVLLALTEGPAPPATVAPRASTHVRPLTAASARLLFEATARSPIVKGLVRDLERTDVIVYVSDSVGTLSHDVPAYLTFVSSAAGVRYLLVRLDRWSVPPWERIANLAHELQHAMEVAAAPEVQDCASLQRLYRRIGWEAQTGRFETAKAKVTGNLARREVDGSTR